MNFPKITPAQIIAALGFAGTEAVNYGLLSGTTEHLVIGVAGIVLPGVLMVADAVVHHAYSKINVALITAEAEKAMQAVEHAHQDKAAAAAHAKPAAV